MQGGGGQAPERRASPARPGDQCLLRRNRTFGTDLTPCRALAELIRRGEARIGTIEDLRLRTTSRLLVLTPEVGEPLLAETCPACGTRLVP